MTDQAEGSGRTTVDPPGRPARTAGPDPTQPIDQPRQGPVAALRRPETQAKALLVIGIVGAINLLLLLGLFALVSGDAADEIVDVDGQRCLVVEEADANALYCRR